ncbi:hypothetical protein V8B55DRAFT_1522749 [Mucor lusitanicus]|uniref:Pectinesterase inhibitor domain-containing protein n=2 Tax=Mucor circinelloides f. lusitanicus TaxID=29924 RepID=A0A168LLI0_MUCCL|nr:hypothetical protein FB192DRAFT_1438956 [Mucor lusitanicus]OAD03683.1 hypothetical protein MUCCIDRAFT_156218 [Mucor lusitanicus CBS 277.49]
MQFTALFITVLSIVLSVNAAAILTKRAAPNVQSCITNLDTVGNQLAILQTSVTEGGILNVNHDYNVLDDAMDDAQLNCCAITSVISDADATEVLGALGNTTPKVLNALNTIKSKEGSYNFLTKAVVRSHLSSFDDKTSRLNTCFNVFIPTANTSTLEGYFNQIKAAFTTTRAAYN